MVLLLADVKVAMRCKDPSAVSSLEVMGGPEPNLKLSSIWAVLSMLPRLTEDRDPLRGGPPQPLYASCGKLPRRVSEGLMPARLLLRWWGSTSAVRDEP